MFTARPFRIPSPAAGWLINDRGIDPVKLGPYLSDIRQSRGSVGFGLATIGGGYAGHRTEDYQPAVFGASDISIFKADQQDAWYVFHDLLDFGSFLTAHPNRRNFIILNGVAATSRIEPYLTGTGPLYYCPKGDEQTAMAIHDLAERRGWAGGDLCYPEGFESYSAYWMDHKGIVPGQQPVNAVRAGREPRLRI